MAEDAEAAPQPEPAGADEPVDAGDAAAESSSSTPLENSWVLWAQRETKKRSGAGRAAAAAAAKAKAEADAAADGGGGGGDGTVAVATEQCVWPREAAMRITE